MLTALAVFSVLALAGGVVAAWVSRNDTICADRKVPVAQRDLGLGRIQYRCHNGQIVQK